MLPSSLPPAPPPPRICMVDTVADAAAAMAALEEHDVFAVDFGGCRAGQGRDHCDIAGSCACARTSAFVRCDALGGVGCSAGS